MHNENRHPAAISTLDAYLRYREQLLRLARRHVHCQADAEDAVHTVFTRLVIRGTTRLPAERAVAFLVVAVRREAQRIRGRGERMQPFEDPGLGVIADWSLSHEQTSGSPRPLPSEPALAQFESALSVAQRRIFSALLAGYNLRQAAGVLGVSVNTVKTQYRRAREKILRLAEREREREREEVYGRARLSIVCFIVPDVEWV